ncbi:MAG: leucine-rich repeat domain-containing protein [Ruminococcus sp.]|nr:leucine-rich repeat domain-containing protein [Ruminococcus sp.]
MSAEKTISELSIYTPDIPTNREVHVSHIALTKSEAKAQGWHYRYKSRRRVRITRYSGSEESVIVPSSIDGCTVNELGGNSFLKAKVRNVSIPCSVKKLSENCFYYSSVENVLIENGLTEIPDRAFSCCRQLRYIHLPRTLDRIGNEAFWNCDSLWYIDIPGRCRMIGEKAFNSSGLRGFALSRIIPFDGGTSPYVEGQAFFNTPLTGKYDMITLRTPKGYNYLDVLTIGSQRTIAFSLRDPNTELRFENRSIPNLSKLDLSHCNNIHINSRSFEDRAAYSSVDTRVKFREDNTICYDIPSSVATENLDVYVYAGADVSIKPSQLGEYVYVNSFSIKSRSLRAAHFCNLRAVTDEQTEVFHPCCESLHGVIWTENGRTYRKLIPPQQILRNYNIHKALLRAFILRGNTDEGGVFFDRQVIDELFRNEPNSIGKLGAYKHDRVLIAIDVLRSTPKPEEESTAMYRDYLKRNRHYAEFLTKGLPPEWRQYTVFIEGFFAAEQ